MVKCEFKKLWQFAVEYKLYIMWLKVRTVKLSCIDFHLERIKTFSDGEKLSSTVFPSFMNTENKLQESCL